MATIAGSRHNLQEAPDTHRQRIADAPHAREIRERLSRASGQLRGVEGMYESGRWCTEVLDQISAVRRALDGVALLLIDDHLSGCLTHQPHTPTDVEQLLDVVRRYIKSL